MDALQGFVNAVNSGDPTAVVVYAVVMVVGIVGIFGYAAAGVVKASPVGGRVNRRGGGEL